MSPACHSGHLVLEMQRPSQQATFGRLPSCEVPLEHLSISRAHAQLTTDGAGNLFVTDLGSGGDTPRQSVHCSVSRLLTRH